MKSFFKKYIPLILPITLVFALCAGILLDAAAKNPSIADTVSGGIGSDIRRAMAYITNPVHISLAELFVIALVIGVIALTAVSVVLVRTARIRVRIICFILSFAFFMYSWYAVAFGVSYHTSPINKKMGFELAEVNEASLDGLALYLVGEINSLVPLLSSEGGTSKMDCDLRQMSVKINSAYSEFYNDYPFFEPFDSYIKPVMLSEAMAYSNILGMYTYYSGEANISSVYPDYCIPAAAAHEFAHQRGVAREDEANFLAYAVSSYSDDPYIKYSGYLNLFEYLISAIARTNAERARELNSMLDTLVLNDRRAYAEFYYAHKCTWLEDIASFFNDTYLRANGTPGVVSYGMVVRLSVSYYKSLGVIG